jgi:hypothetical protein
MRRVCDLGRGLSLVVLPCVLILSFGCRAVDSPEELQALAGESRESPTERTEEVASPLPASTAPTNDASLNGFPLGSVFPGLGGRLHSSLCDPASDPYGTCL